MTAALWATTPADTNTPISLDQVRARIIDALHAESLPTTQTRITLDGGAGEVVTHLHVDITVIPHLTVEQTADLADRLDLGQTFASELVGVGTTEGLIHGTPVHVRIWRKPANRRRPAKVVRIEGGSVPEPRPAPRVLDLPKRGGR